MHDGLRAQLRLHVGAHAQRARDAIRIGVMRRLLRRQQASIDQLLHHRVVSRQAEDLPLVHEVAAAIAHVGQLRTVCVHQERHDGRAGASHRHLGRGHDVYAPAGLLERRAQDLRGGRPLGGGLEHLEDRGERELRGFAPRCVPAHPVADDAEVPVARFGPAARVLIDLFVWIVTGVRPFGVLHRRKREHRLHTNLPLYQVSS